MEKDKKLLVVSYSGFSDQDANGKTLKALLSQWKPQNLMQFYAGNQTPDFSACQRYFQVTDIQAVKAVWGKQSKHYFEKQEVNSTGSSQIVRTEKKTSRFMSFIKKHKYNYGIRMLREYLWMWSPWGKKELMEKIREFSPDAVFYMVGESFAFDWILLKILNRFPVPLILYNAEAYRIIDIKQRHGLDRIYCKKSEKSYARLNSLAKMVLYNCDYLKEHYQEFYENNVPAYTVYNGDVFETHKYQNLRSTPQISYFGNLGVGRVDSLIEIADALSKIDPDLKIDIYGKSTEENMSKLNSKDNISLKGFVDQKKLGEVKNESDILLHAESFDPQIMPKLKFAFSTKIGQYLCAGRCIVSYAPEDMASSQYLLKNKCAVMITDHSQLEDKLYSVITDGQKRMEYAQKAHEIALKNHDMECTSKYVEEKICERIEQEKNNVGY